MGNFHSLEQGQGKLSKTELDRLERRLRKLGRGRTELARSDLIGVEGMDNPFIDRMFGMFDKDGDRLLLLEDMRSMLQVLTQLTDQESRFHFAFSVFDTNCDGVIDRSELLHVLQFTNKRGMTPEQLEQVVDSTIARWDEDGSGCLAYPAFRSLLLASTASLSL